MDLVSRDRLVVSPNPSMHEVLVALDQHLMAVYEDLKTLRKEVGESLPASINDGLSGALRAFQEGIQDVMGDVQDITSTMQGIIETLNGDPSLEGQYQSIKALKGVLESIIATLGKAPDDPAQYSAIRQTIDAIEHVVATLNTSGTAVGQYSAIKQTANEIRSTVAKLNADATAPSQFSSIKQTAEAISSIVGRLGKAPDDPDQFSAIRQTAEAIESKVSQTEFDALSEVVESHGTSITQTANEVALNVVKKNSVVAAINASEEGIRIKGSLISLDGDVDIHGNLLVHGKIEIEGAVYDITLGEDKKYPTLIAAWTGSSGATIASDVVIPEGKIWVVYIIPYGPLDTDTLVGMARTTWSFEEDYNLGGESYVDIVHNLYCPNPNVTFQTNDDYPSVTVLDKNTIRLTNDSAGYMSGTVIINVPRTTVWDTDVAQPLYRRQYLRVSKYVDGDIVTYDSNGSLIPPGHYQAIRAHCYYVPPDGDDDLLKRLDLNFTYLIIEINGVLID